MSATKADKLLRSLIDAGLSLTEFTILATKILRIQRDFKTGNENRRQRDRLRQQDKLREQHYFEQQLKEDEQRRLQGLNKLRELGYITNDEIYQKDTLNQIENKENSIRTDQLLVPYSKEINQIRQKQRDCCLTFNINYDLRRNQQTLERACRRAKRNVYELRAERFNRPESRSVLSVETATLHSKLKETIRELNKMFIDSKSDEDKRYLQELLTYINQFEGDIDLLMCQMQYEPKVKETILFSPVATDILDRMNLILHQVRTLANQSSTGDYPNENLEGEIPSDQSTIPTKVTYIIKIQTNDQLSSSLSDEANVSIKLYGTHTKSPDIHLIQSINKIKWQSGQIDLFNIELNYLGDLYAIEIWHDSEYSSWKVDWIEIIDDAANIYRFPLDRLFDKYSDEKKTRFIIQRNIGPVNRLPTKPAKQIKPYNQIGFSTYTVQVKTGKQPNKATDSTVFIQLKGENGNFSDQLCSANSAFKSSVFEPDQLDTFYLVWPHLAKLNSLHLLVQSDGIQPAWFCEYITVEDGQTGEKYKFIVNQLFDGSNPDDSNLKRHLTVYPENTTQQNEKDKPGYLMKIKTGEKGLSNMSTIPPINLILKGEKGQSEPYTLKSLDNQRKLFQENQIDEFIIPSKYYIGSIKNLQLSSSDNQLDKWFIENIILRDIAQGKDYIFPTYKWFNTSDGKNNLTVQPINERKADYKVYTRTIASELKGPDRSIKLLLQGSKGKQEVELNSPVTMSNTFQPGRKDEYYLENIQSLGDLQSLQVDITHPNIKKLGLDYIEIKDLTTNDSYRFNINRMLDSKKPKLIAKAELIPRSTLNPISSKINSNLSNTTSTMSNRVNFDQLTTNVPQGAKRSDNKAKVLIKVGDQSEDDESNKFEIENKSISILENSSATDQTKDKTKSSDQSLIKDNYQIKIKTINKEFLDKDTKLQVELIDENGQSISNQRENDLQKGKIDTFTVDKPQDFGKLKNVKLSLTDSKSKKKNLYQPESIEIHHPNSNKTHRLEYTKDDLLNSEKNRFELTKPIQPHSDTNIREQTRPQGAGLSHTTINKSPYPKLVDQMSSGNDEDNISLPNHTITSSISENPSKEINSLSDKPSNRQIRPGDRVKNNIKRQLIDRQSKPSLHEADWYGRSMETTKDHRNETKRIQLTTDKHLSQTKFDQRQANLTEKKHDNEDQKINRQISKDETINLLPKTSSSRSLKRSTTTNQTDSKRTEENKIKRTGEKSSSIRQLPINQKRNSDHRMQENHPITVKEQPKIKDKSKPISSSSQQLSTVDQKQMSRTNMIDNPTDTMIALQNRTLSNISELIKPSTTTFEQSKTSVRSRVETNKQRTETSPSPSDLKQKSTTSSIYNPLFHQSTSAPPQSRRSSDSPSSSRIPSNVSSTISKDQSPQLINISSPSGKFNQISQTKNPSATDSHLSQLTSKTITNSTRTEIPSNQLSEISTANKISTDVSSISTKDKHFQRPQVNITDSTYKEFSSQPNTQNISSITIQTTATKSDSDLHSTRKSIDNNESEPSLEKKALLSPDNAKKSRKTSRQNTSKTSGNTENKSISVSQPSNVPSDASTIRQLDNPTSTTNAKYLSKETSDIQNASRPMSGKSRTNYTPLPVEFKASDTLNERIAEYQETISKQNYSNTDETLTQKPSNLRETKSKQSSVESSHLSSEHSSNISTKTGESVISTVSRKNQSLPHQLSDAEHSTTSENPSNISTKIHQSVNSTVSRQNQTLPHQLSDLEHSTTSKHPSNISTQIGKSVISTVSRQNQSLPHQLSDAEHSKTSENPSNISTKIGQSVISTVTQKSSKLQETKSKQSSVESSHLSSKPSSDISAKTGESVISTVARQNQSLPQQLSDAEHFTTSESSSNISTKIGQSVISTVTQKSSNLQETKSKQSSVESSHLSSKPSSNISTKTGESVISTVARQNQSLPHQLSDLERSTTSKNPSNISPQIGKSVISTVSTQNQNLPHQLSDMKQSTTSRTPSNISTKTGQSVVSTVTTQSRSLSHQLSDFKQSTTSKNPSINSTLSTKLTEIDHMSTVYEESEPSTISISDVVTSSVRKDDTNQDRLEKNSTPSSSQPNSPQNQKTKTSSKEKSLSNLLPKSPRGSNHQKKTINAKTILSPTKSTTSIDYEFRVQTGNESQLDGTNEPVAIELINTKGYSMKIPLVNSMNNPKPFQKGQLDIFHLTIPNNFQNIKKINLCLPPTTKDPLHIRYCELQDRQTMNTLYFPIEKWLGEKNAYNVDMYIHSSLF